MKSESIKTIRTAVQTLVGFLPAVPFILEAISVPATAGVGAAVVAVAAGVTRLMQIPQVEALLERLGLHTR